MRILFIFTLAILASGSSFAQRSIHLQEQLINSISPTNSTLFNNNPTERTTGAGDTYTLTNITREDTLTLYKLGTSDSGYVTGTDYWGDQAFAERYDFNGYDSSMTVLGVFAELGGTVNPASTRTINFDLWDQGNLVVIADTLAYSGFPFDLLDTVTVPVTQLGIGAAADTIKEYLFPVPAICRGAFFVGYNINYIFPALNGDTIGLACSKNGERTSVPYTVSGYNSDTTEAITVINVQNATMTSDYNWNDNYTQINGLYNDLAIYPIVVIGTVSDVKSVTRNDLTFYGNYPNPAVNSTNIKFSLQKNADVTIQITDMAGRTINTIKEANLTPGMHIIPVNTSNMAAGDYLYLIRTSGGDGIAGKMSVAN